MTDSERTAPPYLRIAQEIRADIESGKIAPGDMIPSARQIQARYGVATATSAKVLTHLRGLGLVEPRPGVGMIVRPSRTPEDPYLIEWALYPDGPTSPVIYEAHEEAEARAEAARYRVPLYRIVWTEAPNGEPTS